MKINCEECMDAYLSLDKGEKIPKSVTRHLLTCPKCREEIKAISRAEKIAAGPLAINSPVNTQTLTESLRKIDPDHVPRQKKLSLVAWILYAVAFMAAILVFCSLFTQFSVLTFNFSFAFAVCIVVYVSVMVYTNMDIFVKKIDSRKLKDEN
ncbi:MAG: hypothetical protein J6S91_01565 [Treponema sp.]|nr:hypothetical protein [Treponema sp.]